MEKQWYAVYTKPRWEKKVAESLTRNRLEAYCPLNKVVRQWSDRKKIIEEPLFTSYVFIKIQPKDFPEVRKIDGIVNFVYWLGKPAIIRDEEIQDIKDFLDNYQNVHVEKTSINIDVDDAVQIIKGPLIELEGRVISIKSKRARIAIKSLGFSMIAEICKNNLRIKGPSKKSA